MENPMSNDQCKNHGPDRWCLDCKPPPESKTAEVLSAMFEGLGSAVASGQPNIFVRGQCWKCKERLSGFGPEPPNVCFYCPPPPGSEPT